MSGYSLIILVLLSFFILEYNDLDFLDARGLFCQLVGNSTVTELQFTTFFDIHVCIGNSSLNPERRLE